MNTVAYSSSDGLVDFASETQTSIRYVAATKSYQKSTRAAIFDVSLDVAQGDFVVLLGPSGCGKTTLLKSTNRLIELTRGDILIGDRSIREIKVTELRRHMGYVIQQVGLFPHLTVDENVATVPKLLGWGRSRIRQRTEELLELVDLAPSQYARRYPRQLSGGQQQRVGLARAMAADPAIMLMDEPFGAIDAITRTRLQDQLVMIQRKVRKTILFVTHDVEEALKLADKIVVMREGRVVQYDTPFNILSHPANDFVRELLNSSDVLRQLSLITVGSCTLPPSIRADGSPVIRPETSIREALNLMLAKGVDELIVEQEDGNTLGVIQLDQIRALAASRVQQSPVPTTSAL